MAVIKMNSKELLKAHATVSRLINFKLLFFAKLTALVFCLIIAACGRFFIEGGGKYDIPVTGVSLDRKTINLPLGDFDFLTAEVQPSDATRQDVRWSSSNIGRVTVNDGKIAPVSMGTATVTVTTLSKNFSDSCNVTVTSFPTGVQVTGVSLDKPNITMIEGSTDNITATVTPRTAANKAVFWTSNNPGVAKVDNSGNVTAVSAGYATITVTTKNKGRTAVCVITVIDHGYTAVTGVKLNRDTLELDIGDIETLTALVIPNNATNKEVTWRSNASRTATVNNGMVTAISRGTATITVTTVDGRKTDTCVVRVFDPAESVKSAKPAASLEDNYETR